MAFGGGGGYSGWNGGGDDSVGSAAGLCDVYNVDNEHV